MGNFCIKPRPQSNPVECAPACIKMVLDAFSRRYRDRKISLSMKKLKKLIRYNHYWGTPPDYIADGLNQHLSTIKIDLRKKDGGRKIVRFDAKTYTDKTLNFVRDVVNRTYPIVSVKLKYLRREYLGYNPDVSDDISTHDMVVIHIDYEHIYLVDPLRKYTTEEINSCYDKNNLPPTKIPINIFEKAWDETYKWMLLIEEHIEEYKRLDDWNM